MEINGYFLDKILYVCMVCVFITSHNTNILLHDKTLEVMPIKVNKRQE